MVKEIRIRDEINKDYFTVNSLGVALREITKLPQYANYEVKSCDGSRVGNYSNSRKQFILYTLRNETVAHIDDQKKYIWLEKGVWDISDIIDKCRGRVRAKHKRETALTYLSSPFAKGWLKKMRFTVKENEAGKYLFLSILPGYQKISNASFQKLCEAIYDANFNDDFCMKMYIGGKVDWTMFYNQPFAHVNGYETYFCHGVGKDNYSPDDWERDMNVLKKQGKLTQYDYISLMFARGESEVDK